MKTWYVENLHESGLQGRLSAFIENFMKHLEFGARVGATISDNLIQETSVPQKALSTILGDCLSS